MGDAEGVGDRERVPDALDVSVADAVGVLVELGECDVEPDMVGDVPREPCVVWTQR